MNDLSEFVRWAESEITRVTTSGKAFLGRPDRDRYRVYSLARLLGMAETGADIEAMLLVAPGLYETLLRAYNSLLCQRAKLYWQRLEEATDPSWPSHVKNALSEVAERLGLDARALANELDDGEYPRVRNLVVLISQRNLLACR